MSFTTGSGQSRCILLYRTHQRLPTAPALPREQAMRQWQHAASTGSLAMVFFLLVIIVMRISGTG
jgi:hypothetical protein